MSRKTITHISLDDLVHTRGETRADAPEGPDLGPDFWKDARVVHHQAPKKQLTVRLDADMVAWFKAQGKGYQTRMNAVLRSYFEAARRSAER